MFSDLLEKFAEDIEQYQFYDWIRFIRGAIGV
jgi:hypothetical protein